MASWMDSLVRRPGAPNTAFSMLGPQLGPQHKSLLLYLRTSALLTGTQGQHPVAARPGSAPDMEKPWDLLGVHGNCSVRSQRLGDQQPPFRGEKGFCISSLLSEVPSLSRPPGTIACLPTVNADEDTHRCICVHVCSIAYGTGSELPAGATLRSTGGC